MRVVFIYRTEIVSTESNSKNIGDFLYFNTYSFYQFRICIVLPRKNQVKIIEIDDCRTNMEEFNVVFFRF